MIKPDTGEAVEFLRNWSDGFVTIVSISPDKGGTDARSFDFDDKSVKKYIDERQDRRNLYWAVNPLRKRASKKATKEDVESLGWLHVDVDPEPELDIQVERKRILLMLKAADPPANVIIDSGGGYQAFWRLKSPILINGNIPELEAYNKKLEHAFGGDHCHNIDRIMRIPGTVNIPNAKKAKAGRVRVVSKLVHWDDGSWELEAFDKLSDPPEMDEGEDDPERAEVKIGKDDLIEVDVKKLVVADRIKSLIRTGVDPNNPKRYSSRSEMVFSVLMSMFRSDCSPEVIASVMLDKANRISEHFYDQKYPIRYINKQLNSGLKKILKTPTSIIKLNNEYFVASEAGTSGKTTIFREIYDTMLKRRALARLTFNDFKNKYRNLKVQVGVSAAGNPMEKDLGSFWMDHPKRRNYDRIVFDPEGDPEGMYNLWRGFNVNPVEGDWSKMKWHIKHIICDGDKKVFDYLMGWMSRAVQHPGLQAEVAVAMRGKRGTGKGFFASEFGKIFGQHYVYINNSKHLTGNFNAHLQDAVVVFADEAFWTGDKAGENVLKGLITDTMLPIERKGVDVSFAANVIHLIMASNSDHVLPAGPYERRFLVTDVSDDKLQNHKYFGALLEQMNDGGREAWLYDMLEYDLDGFNVRKVPQTEVLIEQKIRTMEPLFKWWFDKLQTGSLLYGNEWGEAGRAELHEDYIATMQSIGVRYRSTSSEMGLFLRKVLPAGYPRVVRKRGESSRSRVWRFPEIVECRKSFDRAMGSDMGWIVPEETSEIAREEHSDTRDEF